MKHEPIVISAFGAVTPLGSDAKTISHALREGKSGIKENLKFSSIDYQTKHAGIPDEGNEKIRWPNKTRAPIGEAFYADLAAKNLKQHPQFPIDYYKEEELGCVLGIDEPAIDIQACFDLYKDKQWPGQNKKALLELLVNKLKLSDCVNIDPPLVLGTIYKNIAFSGAAGCHMGLCSASLQAIGMAVKAIQTGKIKAAIVGGTSAKVTPVNLARLELIKAISLDQDLPPTERSRPFDNRRSGFVLAEGAVMFLIEKLSEVEKRQAKPLLNILGYGSSLSAEHIVAPHSTSLEMRLCMERALKDANISPKEIDLINAHGTSTILNDLHETQAIHAVFGEHATQVKISANKSLHGHLIASAGAMEVLNTLISVNEGFIPGTINLESQDEKFKLNIIRKTEKHETKLILKNSFGMGGLAASMVFGAIS